jgi:hypothetical protein
LRGDHNFWQPFAPPSRDLARRPLRATAKLNTPLHAKVSQEGCAALFTKRSRLNGCCCLSASKILAGTIYNQSLCFCFRMIGRIKRLRKIVVSWQDSNHAPRSSMKTTFGFHRSAEDRQPFGPRNKRPRHRSGQKQAGFLGRVD